MDVLRLIPVPDDGPRPDPAPTQRSSLEQRWNEADGMGGLADVFEQDMSNLPRVAGRPEEHRQAGRVVRQLPGGRGCACGTGPSTS